MIAPAGYDRWSTGTILNVRVPDEESRFVIAGCGMCSREWEISQRMLDSRLARYGMVRCPGCGAELEREAVPA